MKVKVMYMSADRIPEHILNEVQVKRDLWGNKFVTDLRPSAGKSAAKSGNLFEKVVLSELKGHPSHLTLYGVNSKPKYKCHFGLDSREGDFALITSDRKIHIECKQLGNCESHFDKLSHVLMNLISGCYGKDFWLVYDYSGDIKPSGKEKIAHLVKRSEDIKKQVALQGITFELVLIDDLKEMLDSI